MAYSVGKTGAKATKDSFVIGIIAVAATKIAGIAQANGVDISPDAITNAIIVCGTFIYKAVINWYKNRRK